MVLEALEHCIVAALAARSFLQQNDSFPANACDEAWHRAASIDIDSLRNLVSNAVAVAAATVAAEGDAAMVAVDTVHAWMTMSSARVDIHLTADDGIVTNDLVRSE